MRYLENLDARDRVDGTPTAKRLRQVLPQTGRFLALIAAEVPPGRYLEIGTSGGYSTLWIALGCRIHGRKVTTFELSEEKADMALETFTIAGVNDLVDLVRGNALHYLRDYAGVSFCFLDTEKEIYQQCYDAVVPNMISGGIIVADNAISDESALRPMLSHALSDSRVDGLVVPIGKGELVCRKK
jgi:predicted O-methyltransferase YrrM